MNSPDWISPESSETLDERTVRKVRRLLAETQSIHEIGKPDIIVDPEDLAIGLFPSILGEQNTVLVGRPEDLAMVRISPERNVHRDNAITMIAPSEDGLATLEVGFDYGIIGIRTAINHSTSACYGERTIKVFDEFLYLNRPFNVVFIGVRASMEHERHAFAGMTASYHGIPEEADITSSA